MELSDVVAWLGGLVAGLVMLGVLALVGSLIDLQAERRAPANATAVFFPGSIRVAAALSVAFAGLVIWAGWGSRLWLFGLLWLTLSIWVTLWCSYTVLVMPDGLISQDVFRRRRSVMWSDLVRVNFSSGWSRMDFHGPTSKVSVWDNMRNVGSVVRSCNEALGGRHSDAFRRARWTG